MRPGRIFEGEKLLESHLFKYTHSLFKIFITLSREPHNDIGRDRRFRHQLSHPGTAVEIPLLGVAALHRFENICRAALQGNMNLLAYLGIGGKLLEKRIIHMQRMG